MGEFHRRDNSKRRTTSSHHSAHRLPKGAEVETPQRVTIRSETDYEVDGSVETRQLPPECNYRNLTECGARVHVSRKHNDPNTLRTTTPIFPQIAQRLCPANRHIRKNKNARTVMVSTLPSAESISAPNSPQRNNNAF